MFTFDDEGGCCGGTGADCDKPATESTDAPATPAEPTTDAPAA